MLRQATAAGLGILAAAVAATASQATSPGADGLIAYMQQVGGHTQLFTISPDGTRNTQITHLRGDALGPDWSPDGKQLAFTHETPPANGSIALVSARGTHVRELTPVGPKPKGHIWNGDAAFTPDGKSLVFTRNQGPSDSGVWIMRTDGSGLRRLTRNPFVRNWDGGDVDPNVSPNGKVVSFIRIKRIEKLQALFAVRIDGTGLRQLTPYTLELGIKHDWSPDGTRIVVTTNADWVRPHEAANVVTVRPDGSDLTQLTRFTDRKQNAFAGSFSPDGKQIVFRLEHGTSYALAVMDRDGQNLHQLTRFSKAKPAFIDWGTAR